ncbi:MAG TPA: HAMP domain-containing histidine kinase [Cytophagales bacterium]|jgi:two-component system phosphate regulon sensor histidine kinase PhoR|nr:HAMP domain-containing histidine kinase [Cytophagales bacterium]
MSKGKFISIIVLLVTSLLAILYFQFNWILDINELNEDRFNKNVQDALFYVNRRLEEKEIINLTKDNLQAQFKINRSTENGQIELIENTFSKKTIDENNLDKGLKSNFLQFDIESGSNFDNDNRTSDINASVLVENLDDFKIDSSLQKEIDKVLDKSEMIQIVLNKLLSNDKSISLDLDVSVIQNMISKALSTRNINIDFGFIVINTTSKEIVLSNSENIKIFNSIYKINLFENDLIESDLELRLYFPNKNTFLMKGSQMNLFFSLIFIIIVIICFYYVVLKVFEQKKLSDIKNEFIDNMTHELKTPISTISLACEALMDADLNRSSKIKDKYIGIIDDENKRLSSQVERVLQIATLEKGNLQLDFKRLDIHLILSKAVDIIKFKIEKRKGIITQKLEARNSFINGNRVHLLNIINNLLDNSNKYSVENPDILVKTYNKNDSLFVEIADKGIGIKKGNFNKIFEKFFREPQGNVHNVKGFGLGLSYVKNMLEKHDASIQVTSNKNKGSVFLIKFKIDNGK